MNVKKVISYQPPTFDNRREHPSKTLHMIRLELVSMIRQLDIAVFNLGKRMMGTHYNRKIFF